MRAAEDPISGATPEICQQKSDQHAHPTFGRRSAGYLVMALSANALSPYRNHHMRFALFGLILAAAIFVFSGGHVLFLPLFFLLPLGGLFGHRRRYGRF